MAAFSQNPSTTLINNNRFTSSSILSSTSHVFPFPHTQTIIPHKSLIISINVSKTPNGAPAPSMETTFTSRFLPDEPRKGCDILVEALERQGVKNVFAYPGGTTLEIHQALTRSPTIRNILPRHEQGGVFAAEGYARATGFPGVCMATSGPGATNLISGLADAMADSIPIIAITGQNYFNYYFQYDFKVTQILLRTHSILTLELLIWLYYSIDV